MKIDIYITKLMKETFLYSV